MGNNEQSYDELSLGERRRRDTYRARRAHASRRRSRKSAIPGGLRQRRNKHWNW